MTVLNANPVVYEVAKKIDINSIKYNIEELDETREPIDAEEVFGKIYK